MGEETDIIMGVRMDMDQLSGDITSGLELTTTGRWTLDTGHLALDHWTPAVTTLGLD